MENLTIEEFLKLLVKEIAERILAIIIRPIRAEILEAVESSRQPFAYRENKETAKLIGMGLSALRQKRQAKQINFHRDGDIILYTPADIQGYLDSIAHRVVPEPNGRR